MEQLNTPINVQLVDTTKSSHVSLECKRCFLNWPLVGEIRFVEIYNTIQYTIQYETDPMTGMLRSFSEF